jgi:hypothetical protein
VKRHITGLREANSSVAHDIPEGLFLVKVHRARFRFHPQKPYYTVGFTVMEPLRFAGQVFSSRLYCNAKALWKLNWFLRDFGYDVETLGRDVVEECQLVGLCGVVKLSYIIFNGASLTRLDGFAPTARWTDLSPDNLDNPQVA